MFVVPLFPPSRENSSNSDSWDVPCSYMDHWWNQGWWTRSAVEGLVMHWTSQSMYRGAILLFACLFVCLFVCLMLLLLSLQGSKSEHDTPRPWACDPLPWIWDSLQTHVQVYQMWPPVSVTHSQITPRFYLAATCMVFSTAARCLGVAWERG